MRAGALRTAKGSDCALGFTYPAIPFGSPCDGGSAAEALLVDEHRQLGAGIIVNLDAVLKLVNSHCAGLDGVHEQQRELELGPGSVGHSKFAVNQQKARNHG